MLVRFHSKAAAGVTMFGEVAVALLHLMGMSGVIPGAVKAADVPGALRRLKQGLASESPERAPQPAAPRRAGDDQDSEKEDRSIGMRTRAFPLVELLEAAAEQRCDVVWEEEGKSTG